MRNKAVVASQRYIAQNTGYMDGSPVLSMAFFFFLNAEGSLIPKKLATKLMLDLHCSFTKVWALQEDGGNRCRPGD